jgi:segregation and condensation protein B
MSLFGQWREGYLCKVESLRQQLEALIFCAQEPVSRADLLVCARKLHTEAVTEAEVVALLKDLTEQYQAPQYAFEVVEQAGGYRFLTKPIHKQAVATLLAEHARKKLSASALETLAIVAYQQPITKAEVEAIRGVSCDYALLKLLERGLVAIGGRKEAPGRPVLYLTTPKFLEHIGIRTLADLPPVREQFDTHELGEPAEVAMADISATTEDLEPQASSEAVSTREES